MATQGYGFRLAFVMLLLALAIVEAKIKQPPGPDPFRSGNVAKDFRGRKEIVFNVLNFGAKPNGRADCTQSFMKTWVAACHSKESARIVVPSGIFLLNPVVFAGPCTFVGPLIFQIDGTLKAGVDISEFVSDEWILFEKVNNLVVTGRGTLDGQGNEVWHYNDCHANKNCQKLPVSLKLNGVGNALLKGISSINSKGFHMFITNSENIRVRKMHITAPKDSPNTDGIHVSRSYNVKISRSVIATGDDCVSLGQGSTNIAVNKITCGPGHGISVGSLGKYDNEEDVRGLIVKNCTLLNTDNGLRIKTWPDSPPSAASSILFQDINMVNVKNPIIIDQEYSCGDVCKKAPSRVKISDVHFLNVRGTSVSPVAVSLKCSKQFPCQNIELANINLKFTDLRKLGLPISSACSNAKVGYHGIQIPAPCK